MWNRLLVAETFECFRMRWDDKPWMEAWLERESHFHAGSCPAATRSGEEGDGRHRLGRKLLARVAPQVTGL